MPSRIEGPSRARLALAAGASALTLLAGLGIGALLGGVRPRFEPGDDAPAVRSASSDAPVAATNDRTPPDAPPATDVAALDAPAWPRGAHRRHRHHRDEDPSGPSEGYAPAPDAPSANAAPDEPTPAPRVAEREPARRTFRMRTRSS